METPALNDTERKVLEHLTEANKLWSELPSYFGFEATIVQHHFTALMALVYSRPTIRGEVEVVVKNANGENDPL